MRWLPHRLSGLCLWGVIAALCSGAAAAHELRPGYLEITQTGTDQFVARFKVPARGNMRLGLYPKFPDTCTEVSPPQTEQTGGAFMDRHVMRCPGGLTGKAVAIDGLAGTFTDVVARVALADGGVQTARLTPDRPRFEIAGNPGWAQTARAYFLLGVEHILLGVDHLLFVLALLLLVRNLRTLVKTITAFTAAHSITLAAAALGWAQAPQTPVEALIALSIAFAAAEAVRDRRGRAGLLRRAPWIAALALGLLHGFGFGGALREIGLPQSDVPLALLTFNLGIEAGQLLFVAAVLVLTGAAGRLTSVRVPHWRAGLAYAIGSVAVFWFAERLAALP